ncbi:type II toxin-antitoxin system HipA family toxin [Conexibacter sp. JD483]|uniref:type II toxin-antitoxin system HipA family toxin n=1 Tax=unclassified Conexibacter TaxID=2627773 RepID=UPI00271CFEA1|nr:MULTISPECIES: type II toxin-antitoxin system HipA family toxin [unclassified Conexibacter]MDO8185251.1 type II toxin-antitoxin system HipA family toxin [Conexibacter sp. CPCC 205706]MDO8198297.1 type II toxin-antitoxin system HipA family toxin [Conexibacter sp. CPCC 205762]MDR9367742.1 type II toxin-antitoxin system HipA family toxin [Conexibacter sp. JD483]
MSELFVYLAERRVGRLLRKDNGNLQFRYDADWSGPPLSYALPLQPDAHPHAVARAVFGGLLLEGEARGVLARALGLSATNDFGLLEEVGGDCAGAITLLPGDAGPSIAAEPPLLRPLDDPALDRLLRELPQRPLAAGDGLRLSLAGAQPKLPVVLDDDGRAALPGNAATPTTHILKPEPERFPGLVANESFCMALARACGLVVAETRTTVSSSGLHVLVVERYDRDLTSEPIRRLHQEDLCQALGVPSDRKYQAEGGPGIGDVVGVIRQATGVPAQELPRLVRALIFNWLIGNCDAHAKNYSLLYDAGPATLAPLYDLVSTVAYPQLTTRLAMSIGGATRHEQVDRAAWEQLARDVGVRPAFVTRTLDELLARAETEAGRLVRTAPHDNPVARRIAERVAAARLAA